MVDILDNYEARLEQMITEALRRKVVIDSRSMDMPDIEEKWKDLCAAYLPDGMREFAGYPTVSLGWMMYLGMAVAKLWDEDWERYSKEENDIDGPFSLAVSCETSGGGTLIYAASSLLLDESYNAYSSGANLSFVMNCMSSLIGESEALAIRTKSLSYNYLTISTDTAALLKGIMIGVIPLAFVGLGIFITLGRRKKRHEQI